MEQETMIVKNMKKLGYAQDKLFIIKPDCDELAGCTCVPDLASLPQAVDLYRAVDQWVTDFSQAPGVLLGTPAARASRAASVKI